PDVALLVDYQDFNAQLAKRLRKLGIPVLFFIAPSVWAWRSGRAKTFQKYVDLLASIFPFEPEVFRKLGFDRCVYVGHPLHDHFSHSLLSEDEKAAFRKANGLAPERTTVALFPGSRKRELNYHLNALLEGFRLAQKEIPRLQGIVALPGSLDRTEVQARLKDDDSIRIVCGQSLSVLQVADIGALKSGTTNLQAAFAGLPFFMFYKTNLLTQLIVEFFVATKQYSIVNIIRPSTVTELIKSSFTSTRIAQEIIRLAQDTNEQSRLKQIFTEIRESFSTFEQRDELQQSTSAVDRVARLLYQLAQRP
ncbi:MAG: hypothetical protein KDD64_09545, partial [Bdellovibrionales bacterium]|nr:hypothetical protein [Bdellovibrionales bacterium]